jgi:predicted DCC family thiol-disulfide oxidoreductase YuxK
VGADQGLRETDRLFYDGGCGLCHRAVRFFASRDHAGTIRYAPLGGETFRRALLPEVRAVLPDSLVVRTAEGRVLVRAAAVSYLLHRLGGGWRLLGWMGDASPRALSDRLYEALARNRRRWFHPPEEACPILPLAQRARFDP